jgi:hypothetical protein
MKIQPQKIISNLSAKRSTLKPCNSKTSPMTPDFLYNFITLLQSRNTLPQNLTLVPMSGAQNAHKKNNYVTSIFALVFLK